MTIKGGVLVAFQFVLITLLFASGPIVPSLIVPLALYVSGFVLGIAAIVTMRKSKLSVTPEVVRGSTLVKRGPYRYIRHPMYTAVILVMLSLVIETYLIERLLMLGLLVVVLITKLNYEEKLLNKHFKDYKDYSEETSKLVPFFY